MKHTLILLLSFVSVFSFAQSQYFKAQLHCHTTNSDGIATPSEVVEAYKSLGYDILCITDHNYVTDMSSFSDSSFLCFEGEELTSDVHMNGLFLDSTIDVSMLSHQGMIDAVLAQGGLLTLNHYLRAGNIISDSEMVALQDYHFLEIYNHGCDDAYPDDQQLWDNMLSRKREVYGIATDDMHNPSAEHINGGWVMIRLDSFNLNAIYHALEQGDFYSSTGVEMNVIEFSNNSLFVDCANCDSIVFYGENHSVLKKVASDTASYLMHNEMYVRALMYNDTLPGEKYIRAWTQAFYNPNYTNLLFYEPNAFFKLYPNPTNDAVTLEFDEEFMLKNKNCTINIYAAEARLIYNQEHQITKRITIDISSFPSGMYYLEVVADRKLGAKFFVN
jgi:predicted metal-dependent phosphoesterase TrpH